MLSALMLSPYHLRCHPPPICCHARVPAAAPRHAIDYAAAAAATADLRHATHCRRHYAAYYDAAAAATAADLRHD